MSNIFEIQNTLKKEVWMPSKRSSPDEFICPELDDVWWTIEVPRKGEQDKIIHIEQLKWVDKEFCESTCFGEGCMHIKTCKVYRGVK